VLLGDEEREHGQHESLISKRRRPGVCGVLLLELLSQSLQIVETNEHTITEDAKKKMLQLFSMVEAYLNSEATSAEVKGKNGEKKVRIVVLGRMKAYRISMSYEHPR